MQVTATEHLYAQLDALGIAYVRVEHPAVFTCDESARVVPPLPGAATKNLFLRDKKGRRHLLVVTAQDKRIDLKRLGELLDAKGLMLASDERLVQHLGVGPGAVSILALVNDGAHAVELVVDRDLWSADAILAHPLVNTATLVLPRDALQRFLEDSGHAPLVVELPQSGAPA
ncbi:MAG: prolyl-tRNA synthetase associated domain-containing protein [Betaproteobacteria bacterium]